LCYRLVFRRDLYPVLRPYAALWAIVITLLDTIALDRWQKNLKYKAASIQERFDCDVLELPWPELKVRYPDAELIAEQSSQYRRIDPNYKTLRNWYAPSLSVFRFIWRGWCVSGPAAGGMRGFDEGTLFGCSLV